MEKNFRVLRGNLVLGGKKIFQKNYTRGFFFFFFWFQEIFKEKNNSTLFQEKKVFLGILGENNYFKSIKNFNPICGGKNWLWFLSNLLLFFKGFGGQAQTYGD